LNKGNRAASASPSHWVDWSSCMTRRFVRETICLGTDVRQFGWGRYVAGSWK
jgi:hypothetical protein